MGIQTALDLLPNRWGSQPYPPPGYAGRWSRNMGLWRGYPETDGGFQVLSQMLKATNAKPGGTWVHSHTDGTRHVIGYYNDSLYYWNDAVWGSIKSGLTAVYVPSFANMGLPLGMSLFVNGTDAPQGIREAAGAPAVFAANFEAPDAGWTAAQSTGGSLADGTYLVRIAQVEVHATTGTIISGPAAAKTVTITAGGGTASILVSQAAWTPNAARATHWRIGVTALNGTDAPSSYFHSGTDTAIATTSVTITSIPTVTPPFESRNGFYKVTDLTEIISGKHPRGVLSHKGRWFVWYADDNRIVWSERDEWGWYSTNSLDTGAESGWNLPVLCLVPYRNLILAFTADAVHGIFGDFSRDLDGAAPTFAAMAQPEPLVPGLGLAGGVEAAKAARGRVWWWSTSGPAVFPPLGAEYLLAPEDFRLERACLDTTYAPRRLVVEDPRSGDIIFAAPRKVNSSRAMDGASVAGVVDTLYRWIPSRNVWDIPLQLDVTHLSARTNGTAGTAHEDGPILAAVGPDGGAVLRLGIGHAGGVLSVGGANYDSVLASANTTTTATVALAGIAADELVGQTVVLTYPSGDSTYPYVSVQKSIKDNTATAGGNVDITWAGALTVPSTSFWTVRLAGLKRSCRFSIDPRAQGGAVDAYWQLHQLEMRCKDRVGAEAVS